MKLTKFSLITTLLIFSVIFTGKVMAENNPSERQQEGKSIKLAAINVQDAKIISQKGNTLNLSFNINNKEGAQSGVKYGVRISKKTDGDEKIVDEYVYSEVLSVPANVNIAKEIKYTAPSNIDGVYNVFILAKNYSGLPLGMVSLGEITFIKGLESLEILTNTCTTETEAAGSIKNGNSKINQVSKEDKIILSCVIKNNQKEEVLVNPVFETFYRTLYGEEVPQIGGDMSPILLRPLEEKMVNLTLPKIAVPQSYVTKVSVASGDSKSNSILVSYTVSGLSATVQNVSLDKNSYKANETAKLSFFWTSSATNREELTSISLTADIVNKNKKSCIDNPLRTQMAGVGFIEIPVTMSRSCEDPEVTVALLDATGKVLDQKALVFEASEKSNMFAGKTGIIAIVILGLIILAGIIMYFKKSKKDNNKDDGTSTPKSGHIEGAMLTIFFAILVSLIPGGVVKADTWYFDYYIESGNTPSELTILEVNIDKSVYQPGENITFRSSVTDMISGSWGRNSMSIYLSASTNSVTKVVRTGEASEGDYYAVSFTAPENGGTYNVNYEGYTSDISGTPYPINFNGSFLYKINEPVIPVSVTITANNTPDILNVTSGTDVTIRWTTENAKVGTVCTCTYNDEKDSCGISYGPILTSHNAGQYPSLVTTTYKVSCK